MWFLLGLLIGSVFGFIVASFCNLAARKVSCSPAETVDRVSSDSSEATEEVA